MHFSRKTLQRYVLSTMAVGLFSLTSVAYALPTDGTSATATIKNTSTTRMDIAGSKTNNVINWQDFSIANGETVQFDTNNYLNLVRGASKSEINGALNGTGNIYLINPNGILFGATAQVNVGNLVASTRAIDKVDADGFAANGTNPLATAVKAATGDIVNLGKLQAASVVLEGNNITIQNAADLTSDGTTALTSQVIAKADGVITVGHEVTKTTTRSFNINGTATDKTVHDYAKASAGTSGYVARKLNGTTTNAVKESMLVDNVYDLQNMDASLSGNYMLSGNIDASETSTWSDAGTTNLAGFNPVGYLRNSNDKAFYGSFDGAMHTINGLTINRAGTASIGLFGNSRGIIQNVGLVGGSIVGGDSTGGVAGYATKVISNVYNTGSVSGTKYVGGVVGNTSQGTTIAITNVYNTGTITGAGDAVGGVVGWNYKNCVITNAYNTGSVSNTGEYTGGVVGENRGTITNAHNTGSVTGTGDTTGIEVGGIVGNNQDGVITNAYNTGAISSSGGFTGGIAGANQLQYGTSSTITNVYNTGTVSSTGQCVGGVVGLNYETIKNAYNTGSVSSTGNYVGGVVGQNQSTSTKVASITNVYNTGSVSSTGSYVGGVVGSNESKTSTKMASLTNAYNTGAVSGKTFVGGVAGGNGKDRYTYGTIQNVYNIGTAVSSAGSAAGVVGQSSYVASAWYATTDAAGNTINSGYPIGTGKTLAELQAMDLTTYRFDTTNWRTNATDGSTALVATTPMLKAFINKDLDSQIAHTKVQYGTAETPLVNIYETGADVTLDWNNMTVDPNVGATIYGNNLTVNNFNPASGNSSTWGSYGSETSGGNLILQNDNGFTVNKNMELLGTNSITLSAKNSSTGTIIDYGKNITPTLKITAKDIVLDTDRVDTAAGNAKTAVTLNAAGTAKAGYTPKNTMTATVNGVSVSVPDYAKADKRDNNYPSLAAGNGGVAVSEGQWIKNVTELQAMGTSADTLSKTYFLYGDIDASATKSWNWMTSAYQGFVPVGNWDNHFTGTFDGLNHTINGLTINRSTTDYVGLFGYSQGTIQNVGLVGGSITGHDVVGGVVGESQNVTITNVYNTGTVIGTNYVGGVVGFNNNGTITNAYNTGAVSGTNTVGGVVGYNLRGNTTNVYNTGAVSGTSLVGGVAGYNSNTITNAYNTGTVRGTDHVGGVVGDQYDKNITNTYNTGKVSGTGTNIGGVVGYLGNRAKITNALWAKDADSTVTQAVGTIGNATKPDDTVKGANLADMKKAATYVSWTGTDAVSSTGGAGTAWRIYEGNTTPLLTSFFKGVITVTGLSDQSVTYNGTTQKVDLSSATYSSANIDASHILAGSGRNAGTYNAIYSDQQGYDLVNTNTLTITPKTLTATLTGKTGDTYVFTKTYDGTTSVTKNLVLGDTYTFDNAVSGDTVSIAANSSGTYADKNVGDGKNAGDDKTIKFTGITLTGADAGNYTIADTLSGNVGQITKKNITASLNALNGTYVFTKTYDGGTDVQQELGTNYSFATGDIESGDKVSLTAGTSAYTDKNVGDTKEITFGNLLLGGDAKGNYNLTTTSLTGNVGKITKKNITASLNALNGTYVFTKTYDGGTDVKQALGTNYSFAAGDIEKGDTVSLTAGTSAYTDKNVGDTKEITFGNLVLGGAEEGNYNLTTTSLTGNVGQITAKELTITLAGNNTFTKEYDGKTDVKQPLAGNYNISGIVGTEKVDLDSAGVGGTYADKNAADGKLVQFTVSGLTGDDKANYRLKSTILTGNVGKITPKALTATLTGDNVFTKVYDGTTAVSQALTLGTNCTLDGIVSDRDKLLLSAGSGTYNDKNAGDNKAITFSGLTLTGEGEGNYTIASTLSGAVGQITRKTITGSLASGYSFDKVYDGTTTATLGNGYTLNGVVAGDTVPLTAANGFYDSSAVGDRTVTFSGFSINDGNYLLSMADSLTGKGKITSGSQDHNYSDALAGVSSFFGANPSDGYTIFSGTPEDYIPRAVTQNNGQSYQVGVAQVTQTWYNGPASLTIINGGILLPKDILLGSTFDTRTVVLKGGNGYEI